MGRRQGPAEERRAAILEAAEAVFTEGGYHGASIRAIAQRAGVSSALLYWFFPNKAKLFAAVMLARIEASGGLPFPAEIPDLPPEVLLPRVAARWVAMMSREDQLRIFRLVLRDADREPDLTAILGETIAGRILQPLAAYFRRQMDLGRLRRADPDYMVMAFMGPLIGTLLRRHILQEPVSKTWNLPALAETTTRLFLQGALLPPGEAPAAPTMPPERREEPALTHPRRAERVQIEE